MSSFGAKSAVSALLGSSVPSSISIHLENTVNAARHGLGLQPRSLAVRIGVCAIGEALPITPSDAHPQSQ